MSKTCPMIQQNESSTDRIIRVIIGIALFIAGSVWFTGITQTIILVIAAIALITGIIGFCGLYALLGISTKSGKK